MGTTSKPSSPHRLRPELRWGWLRWQAELLVWVPLRLLKELLLVLLQVAVYPLVVVAHQVAAARRLILSRSSGRCSTRE